MSLGGGGRGEIPKGGRAGRARFLGIWPWGGEVPRVLAPGRARSRCERGGGAKSLGHRLMFSELVHYNINYLVLVLEVCTIHEKSWLQA